MSFDLEKGADAAIQQPTTARLPNSANPSNFPPAYEHHLNDNMRRFSDQFHDVKLRDFDGVADSKPKQRKCPTWVWFTVGAFILMLIAALLGGLIIHYTNKHSVQSDKTSIQTRSEQTTTISPLTTTVTITESPSTAATPLAISTLEPSTSTSLILTVTSTTTASSSESSSITTTTASEPATTSLGPSEAAAISSIYEDMSSIRDKLHPSPIETTLMSITTTTAVSISTPPPERSPDIISMPGGSIGFCGVPGQACYA